MSQKRRLSKTSLGLPWLSRRAESECNCHWSESRPSEAHERMRDDSFMSDAWINDCTRGKPFICRMWQSVEEKDKCVVAFLAAVIEPKVQVSSAVERKSTASI